MEFHIIKKANLCETLSVAFIVAMGPIIYDKSTLGSVFDEPVASILTVLVIFGLLFLLYVLCKRITSMT